MRYSKTYDLRQVWYVLAVLAVSSWSASPGAGVLAQTYKLSDGDIVHCIPIEDQPSLRDLARPHYNKRPTTRIKSARKTEFPYNAEVAVQTFAREVGACPTGTIPVRTYENGTIASHLDTKYRKKKHRTAPQDSAPDIAPHEYAIAEAPARKRSYYKGTEVVMSIWDPYVENDEEFSLAQLWLAGGDPINTVEVGYQVYEGLGGDYQSRLFVYWTADSYVSTGCYDLECPGFVQVSNKVLIRGAFAPVSTYHGERYEIKLRVFRDDVTHDWWLQLNDEFVGYWPGVLYTANGLQKPATTLEWGGEIVDDLTVDGNRHTKTDMGSGREAIRDSAYMRNLKYVNPRDRLLDSPISITNTKAACYKSTLGDDKIPEWGSYFYFGGPGYNSKCRTDPRLG